MTFKSFLLEDDVADIQRDCQKFIKESGGLPLYRGVSGISFRKISKVTPRKDREPRDTRQFIHDMLNDWFMEHGDGLKARSEAVFTTGNLIEAKEYGTPKYVFPIGNFNFIWGEKKDSGLPVKDTYAINSELEKHMGSKTKEQLRAVLDAEMAKIEWHWGTQLERAIKEKAEIMLFCNEMYLVSTSIPYSEIISGQV